MSLRINGSLPQTGVQNSDYACIPKIYFSQIYKKFNLFSLMGNKNAHINQFYIACVVFEPAHHAHRSLKKKKRQSANLGRIGKMGSGSVFDQSDLLKKLKQENKTK